MRKRAGILLMAGGLALAVVTGLLVMGIARQASAASHAQVRQVEVVVTTRDILDHTPVTADALELKPFPAEFAPAGAFSSLDDLVGKVAQGFIPKGQVIVAGQLQVAQPAPNLSDRIRPGMVVMWLPMPDLLANDGPSVLKPGDHVDILLTAPIKSDGGSDKRVDNLSTQTTLQNVEIYRIGDAELNGPPPANPPTTGAGRAAGLSPTAEATAQSGHKAIGVLVSHQDAVTMKFVKDAGGSIDLATRSTDDQQVVRTDGVTLDSLAERFRFRVPQPVQPTDTAKPSGR